LEDTPPAPPAYQPPGIPKNPESTAPSDRSQQQTTPETPIQPTDEKAQVEENPPEEKNEPKRDAIPPPVKTHSPEERKYMSQAQEQRNPQGGPDDSLRSHPPAENTTSPIPPPMQSQPTQPFIPTNNSQHIRQQVRGAPRQQRRQEEPASGLGGFWKSFTGGD